MRCLDVILQYKDSSGAQIPDPGTCADSRLRYSTCKQGGTRRIRPVVGMVML